jgi:hypothetical protein
MSKKKSTSLQNEVVVLEVDASREIAEIQLERLKIISRERLLTFEETRIFDILTKNLFLSKGKATDIVGSARKALDDADTDKLIQIATQVTELPKKVSVDVVDDNGDK